MPSPPHIRQARRRARFILASAAVLVPAIGGVLWAAWPRSLRTQLAAIVPDRSIAPLTSLKVRYRPCPVAQTDSLVPQVSCPKHTLMPGDAAEALLAKVNRRLETGRRDADALETQGLIQLYGTDRQPPRPAEAIATFETALQFTHDSAGVMADLAAAYLLLAEQSQSASDLDQALEWSDRALELDPRSPQALFNRALSLESLMADSAAKGAWRAYLAASRPPGLAAYLGGRGGQEYRREAEQRLRALEDMAPPAPPALDASEQAWRKFAGEYPQMARQNAWDGMLSEWAKAVEKNDTALAATWLRRAEVVGEVLVSRPNGDSMVIDHVREIRARMVAGADPHGLAHAQRIEADATQAARDLANAKVDSLLGALRADSMTVPLRVWSSLQRAAALINMAEWDRAGAVLSAATADIDSLRYPVAAGYALWLQGTIQARHGVYEKAVETWTSALDHYGRSRERASHARLQALIAEALADVGNVDAASEWYQRSVRESRSLGSTLTRHNALRSAAISAELMGMHRAMRDLADEDVAVAEQLADPAFIAEARLNRAALLAVSGHTELALRDLASTTRAGSVTPLQVREFVTMVTAYVRALAQLDTHPDSVAYKVAPLIAYKGTEFWRVRGLSLRARAAVRLGNTARARMDLDSVFAALRTFRTATGGAQRKSPTDVSEALERLVTRMVEQGDTTGSLALLERGAAVLAPIEVGAATLPRRIPPGRVVIRPFLVDSTLVVWTMDSARVEMHRTRVNPDSLRAAIGLVMASMPLPLKIDAELNYLYRLLIGPSERRLGAVGDEIVFVDDANLGAIPYAALQNDAGEPLILNHPVWVAVSVAAAATPAETTRPGAVAVFAPAFDGGLNPALDALPAAGPERDSVTRAYGGRVMKVDETPEGFRSALSKAQVVHFAGHAVTDPLRPERSYLVLAPGSESAAGHLTAGSLAAVDLRRVRLVVLSACSTLGDGASGTTFTGLSGALLDRGAHGVIGSLWPVGDSSTGVLMVTFHQNYARSGNPQRALWEAQRSRYQADAPRRTWAAFRYVGR